MVAPHSSRWIFPLGLVFFFLSGCQGGYAPELPPPSAHLVGVSCDDIPASRDQVGKAFTDAVDTAGVAYAAARAEAERTLKDCLAPLWKGGSCDEEAKMRQKAYEAAMSDISNEQAYQTYKTAKTKWDECYARIEEKNAAFQQKNEVAERSCQERFQNEVAFAEAAYQGAVAAAKAQREADYAYLDEAEKACRENPEPPSAVPSSPEISSLPPKTVTGAGAPPPQDLPIPCEPVPGENAMPRTGKAPDFGPKDIIINLITTVAEDVTKGPVPTSIVSDQIFAGIVVVKIRTRIVQMTREMADALAEGRNNRANFLERKIKRYETALSIWGKIAEGRPPADIKERVETLQGEEHSVFCPPPAMEVQTTVDELQIRYGN